MLGRNHTMEFEEQGEIVGKELSLYHEDSLNSCALILKHEEATLFYHLLSREFFDKVVFKEEGRKSWNFENFVATIPHLNFEAVEFEKHQDYCSVLNAFDYLGKAWKSLQDYEDTLKS
ncbi:hypothetical protein M9H77_13074 [Catharanthus roseus]|uniref:Uncharacterized protein n=1 Tax=Catharanthus roseus TaxID=4058 RepID=A0ACC0BJ37_CATRO|nr:hypothetical protein M9H77_13074 [Catharanthus roseus]